MADEIVARYRLETEAAAANARKLADANDKVTKSGVQAQGSLDKMAKSATTSTASVSDSFDKMATNVTNQLKSVATTIAAAFAVERLISFGAEAVKVAAKVEGVKVAFARLNDPTLLNELRKATKNTVDDLTLMQFAIRADNFKIPLEQLGVFLEFARRRAKETGTELNYMMESIMTAVGRGSIEVWDNLGISLTEVRSKLNGVSIETISVGERAKLMGDLATAELTKMGVEADTTADKLGQISATTENIKAEFGALIIDAIQPLNDELSVTSTELGKITGGLSGMELIGAAMKNVVSALQEPINALNKVLWGFNQGAELTAHSLMMIELAATKNFVALRRFMSMNDEDRNAFMAAWHGRADAVKAVGDELDKVSEKQEKDSGGSTADQIRNIYFLTNAINALNEERAKEGTTVDRIKAINQELIPLQAELDALLGKQKDKVTEVDNAYKEWFETLEKFEQGIKKMQDNKLEMIDLDAERDKLIALRTIGGGTEEQQQALADRLNEIERDRLQKRIDMLKSFGREAIDEQVKMAEMEVSTANDIYAQMEADYQKFLEGQDADYEGSIRFRIKKAEELAEAEMRAREDAFAIASTLVNGWLDVVTKANEYEMIALENQLQAGQITREEYEKERRKLLRDQAENQKAAALMNAIVSTAAAVATALTAGPVSGQILAALTAALGAVQIGIIAAEPIPQFGKGGWVEGKKHSEGGTMIEAEKGEFIVSAAAAKRYAPILEQINKQTFQPPKDGWDGLAASISLNSQFTDRNLLVAIDRHREKESQLLMLIANRITQNRPKRGGYA